MVFQESECFLMQFKCCLLQDHLHKPGCAICLFSRKGQISIGTRHHASKTPIWALPTGSAVFPGMIASVVPVTRIGSKLQIVATKHSKTQLGNRKVEHSNRKAKPNSIN